MPADVFEELEQRCHAEARLIIHMPELWEEYRKEAQRTYSSRLARFPDTNRVVAEYAPSFQIKFGSNLKDAPETVEGAVVREDLYIVQGGTLVAQYINFYAREDFGGRTIEACIGSFPELYAEGANGP